MLRFTCLNASWGRRTFDEQTPGLTRRHSQRTEQLRSTLADVGLALAGRAGARLADVFGVAVSRSTVLRLVDALPEPEPSDARVVGVDEYATRKGRHYGTVLVDVETRRPVDLLPDREAASLAVWLSKRSGVEVVCRDRAPFFAEGATAGAPQERLPDWLDAVRENDLPSLHTLAAGLERDREAVIAGLTLPWSWGVVEGRVKRIKMLKRQMFGPRRLRRSPEARPRVLITDQAGRTRWQQRRRMCEPLSPRSRPRRI